MCSKVIIENANLKSCLKFYRLGVQLDSSILTERMGAYIIENIELVFYRLIKKFSYEELVLLSEKYQEMRCSKSVRAIGNCSASNLDISQHVTDDMYNSINECDDENVVYEVFDTMEASFEEKSDDESVFLDSRGEIPSLEGKTNSKKEPFRFEGNADNTISSSLPWRRKVSEQKSDDPTVSFSKILQEQAKSNFRVSSPPFGSPTKKSTSNDPGKSAIPNGLSLMDFITNGKSKKKKSKRGTLFAESPKKSPWSSHMNASKTSFSDIVKEQEMSPKKPGFSSYKSVIEGSGSAWRLPIPLVNSEPQSLRDIQWEEVKLGLRKDRTVENNHLNQKSFPRLSASTSLNSRARSNVSKPTNSGTLLPRKLF